MTVRRRWPPLAALLLGAALAACQTADTAGAGRGLGDGPGNHFRERRGWEVAYVAAADGAPAHCRGRRSNPGADGLTIAFIAAANVSGFRLTGLPPGVLAAFPAGETATDEITARFDPGDSRVYPARRDGDALLATFPTADYEDALHGFGRARTATLTAKRGGLLGSLTLNGSAWAINATDECRRMRTPAPAARPVNPPQS